MWELGKQYNFVIWGEIVLARLGRWIGVIADNVWLTRATVVACALVLAIIGFLAETSILRSNLTPLSHSLLDACIEGAGGAIILWIVLHGNRARRRLILAELERLAELNHVLRNSLQVIANSEYFSEEQRKKAILEHVERIDVTLRKLFPVLGGNADGSTRPANRLFSRRGAGVDSLP